MQNTREVITNTLKYVSGKTLDLGAGRAKYRDIIKGKAQNYTTFDLASNKNADVAGDAMNLPFKDETFDTIISTQVLEHVEKPWIMVKEINRTLKRGGICILTAPFLAPYHPDPEDYFRYTAEGLKSLFKNENFQIIECSGYGRPFFVLSEFVRFSLCNPYKKRRRGSWTISRLMAKIAGFLDKFTKGKIIYSNVYIVAQK